MAEEIDTREISLIERLQDLKKWAIENNYTHDVQFVSNCIQSLIDHYEGVPSRLTEIVSDEELDKAWGNANFGNPDKRTLLKYGLLKCMANYHQGRTMTEILKDLKLANEEGEVTPKGNRYLWYAFGNGSSL
jgi:hypothetical protein